ncbi:MAG: hypothetical protein SGI99_17210 [Pseudomonadota bacterium]|nr:hypothetical protein [Pseudomonadota bacterium]
MSRSTLAIALAAAIMSIANTASAREQTLLLENEAQVNNSLQPDPAQWAKANASPCGLSPTDCQQYLRCRW